MNRYVKMLIVFGLMSVLLYSGCARRTAIVKDTFLLSAHRSGKAVTAASDTVLAVQPFSIGPAYQGKGLVYRTAENQYESDFYNEYFVSPQAMMAEQTRNWLSASGVFSQVLSPISSAKSTHVLEGHIRQIGVDIRDEANPHTVLEVSFFLLEQGKRERTVYFDKTYLATVPMEEKTASSCITALNQCLEQILGGLEADLASAL